MARSRTWLAHLTVVLLVLVWPIASAAQVATPESATESAIGWPTYRGNAARTGVATSAGPVGNPVELWRVQMQGGVNSEPAVVGGIVYIGSDDGSLYALDTATGEEQWKFAAGDAVSSSPAVAEGTIYAGAGNGILYALDAATGEERWQFPGARAGASPAVEAGVVYTGNEDGQLYALDAENGEVIWRHALGDAASRSPAVADGIVYIGSGDAVIHAVDAASGEERWTYQTDGGVISTPVVAGGIVYECAFEGPANRLYALDANTGELRWSFETATGDNVWVPTVDGGMAFTSGSDGRIYALDAATGEEQWHFQSGDQIISSPTLADGVIYALSFDRNLYAVDATDGTELWRFAIDGLAEKGPTIVDGVAYFGTALGSIYAVGSSGSASQLAPPMASQPVAEELAAAPISALPAGTGPDIARIEFAGEITGGDDPLDNPTGVTVDRDGHFYIVDTNNDRIRVFDRDGNAVAAWGETGTEPGQFRFHGGDGPWGDIEIGPDGSVYVVEPINHRVQKFSPDGELISAWGGFGPDEGQFNLPASITIDKDGRVYVVDQRNDRVQVFDADGAFIRAWGSSGSEPEQLRAPFSVAIAPDGTFLVSSAGGPISRYDAAGAFIGPFEVTAEEFPQPTDAFGIDIDAAGNVYLQDWETNRMWVLGPDGALRAAWGETGSGPGQFNIPTMLSLDRAGGYLFIADEDNDRVQIFRLLPPLG